jgi:hypothetical protein
VSLSALYAACQDSIVGSLSVIAPDINDIAVTAGAAGAEESRNYDCSRWISASLLMVASMIANDVLPGRADSRSSMLAMFFAKSTIRLLFIVQH